MAFSGAGEFYRSAWPCPEKLKCNCFCGAIGKIPPGHRNPAAGEPLGMSRFSLVLAALAIVAAPALAQNNAARDYGVATTTNIWAGV